MSEGKHTPGPWGYVYHRGLGQHLVGATLENVAIVEARHGNAEANAALIAAAPDMLAALKAVAALDEPSPKQYEQRVNAAINAACSAITRAEGR